MRKTTAYLVRVETAPGQAPNDLVPMLADRLQGLGHSVEQTATYNGTAGVRFRIPTDDEEALNIARQIALFSPFVVSTGYGVHQREVGASQ